MQVDPLLHLLVFEKLFVLSPVDDLRAEDDDSLLLPELSWEEEDEYFNGDLEYFESSKELREEL